MQINWNRWIPRLTIWNRFKIKTDKKYIVITYKHTNENQTDYYVDK